MTFSASRDRRVVAKQKCRLLGQAGFPVDLGDLIRPVGRGAQKLDLPADHIRIFESVTTDTLGERTA